MNRRSFLRTILGLVAAPALAVKALDAAAREASQKRAIDSMLRYQQSVFDALEEAKIDLFRIYKSGPGADPIRREILGVAMNGAPEGGLVEVRLI